ncbi:hypothetical protein J6590_095174 [Homalodisca vitripennis]|nr:hypothetical protein J6590_095174 [Homalodisca vitripennis]
MTLASLLVITKAPGKLSSNNGSVLDLSLDALVAFVRVAVTMSMLVLYATCIVIDEWTSKLAVLGRPTRGIDYLRKVGGSVILPSSSFTLTGAVCTIETWQFQVLNSTPFNPPLLTGGFVIRIVTSCPRVF